MRDDFSDTLNRMLKAAGKSIQQAADHGGVDAAYLRKLSHGEKRHPSPLTVTKIYCGIIMTPELMESHPDMVHGLAELLLAAASTAAHFDATGGDD